MGGKYSFPNMLSASLNAEKEVNILFLYEFKIQGDVKMLANYMVTMNFGVFAYQTRGISDGCEKNQWQILKTGVANS